MMSREHFHNALSTEDYDRLVALFGEEEHKGTKWVSIGAGGTDLTFFAPRQPIVPILDADGTDLTFFAPRQPIVPILDADLNPIAVSA